MAEINPAVTFKRGMFYSLEGHPDNEGLVVYEDFDGRFYLKNLIKIDGFYSPFASIEAIEKTFETKLTLEKEDIFSTEPSHVH